MNNKTKFVMKLISIAILSVFLFNCTDLVDPQLSGDKKEIDPPETDILNVPAPNNPDSVLYLTVQTISWRGLAPNSIIKGYHYKIETVFMNSGQTLEQDWKFTKNEQEQIVFPSSEKANKQTIIVKAEDREGRVDPTPDTLIIYTRQSINPETEIKYPSNNDSFNDTLLVKKEADLLWSGIRTVVAGTQPNPFNYKYPPGIMDYQYKIDDGEWSENIADTVLYIDPGMIEGQVEGPHKLYVRSRNTAFKADTTPAVVDLYFALPEEDRDRWLIIDDTYNSRFGISDDQENQFYIDVFETAGVENFDTWDYYENELVPMDELKKYDKILYHCEHNRKTHIDEFVPQLWQFLDTGGNLWITSRQILDNLDRMEVREKLKYFGDFTRDVLHLNGYYNNAPNKLQGAIVTEDQDTAYADDTKYSQTIGGIDEITVILDDDLGNFSEPVFQYFTADSGGVGWNGSYIGTGYYNDNYRIVFCGFPLYYFTIDGAVTVLDEVREYFAENKPF